MKSKNIFQHIKAPIKVAVLGCAVNGPGEAREADIGIAGARGEGLLFMKGKTVRKVPEETMVEELKIEIDKLAEEYFEKKRQEELLLQGWESGMRNLRFGIDIDGTVTCPTSLLPHINEQFGCNLVLDDIKEYDLTKAFTVDEQVFFEWYKGRKPIFTVRLLHKHMPKRF